MNAQPSLRRVATVVLLCGLLAGATQCSYRGKDFGGGGSQGDAVAVGPVTGFGSVYVNGVEYSTTSATFTLNGAATSESALVPGRLVGIAGTRSSSSARARAVTWDDRLVGPVTDVDRTAGTLTVLGQVVQLTGATVFGTNVDPADASAFVVGQSVAVDGYRTSDGLRATRVDRPLGGQPFRVLGRVSNLSTTARTFRLGPTTVDYRNAGTLDSGVRNGAYVLASGLATADDVTLVATAVILRDELPANSNGDDGSVRGMITRFGTATDFDVGGQAVSTSASTQYAGGASGDLALDREVEIDGEFDRSGVLVATRVTFHGAATFRVVGSVDRLSASASTLEVAGITVTTNARTLWDDRAGTALRTFEFGELRTGDWVEVRGTAGTSDRTATAVVVERRVEPANARVELQGAAGSVASTSLTIAGTNVTTSSATFRDAEGTTLGRTEFTSQAPGAIVRARGRLSAGTLVAESAELRPTR